MRLCQGMYVSFLPSSYADCCFMRHYKCTRCHQIHILRGMWRTPQRWPSVGSGTGWSRCRTPASPSRLSWRTVPWPPDQRAPHAAQHAGLPRCVRSCTSCHPSLTASRSALTHLLSVHTCNAACTMTFDIDYILVVGQFGLATGSGGITQSNVHNELCPK